MSLLFLTTRKGLEPSIFGVTGRRDNQLRYRAVLQIIIHSLLHFCKRFLLYFSLGGAVSLAAAA